MSTNEHKSTTGKTNAGKTSVRYANSHRKGGNEPRYSTISCREEKKKGKCDKQGCTYLHQHSENIELPSAARFDKKSHKEVPNPQSVSNRKETLYMKFFSTQMNAFHAVLTKGMPRLFKNLLILNEGAFEAIGRSFMSAKDYDAFFASLREFSFSVDLFKRFVVSKLKIFAILEEEGSSSSEVSSSDYSSSEDETTTAKLKRFQDFWNNLQKYGSAVLRGSVSNEGIKSFFNDRNKPAGTYKTLIAQLSAFDEDIKTFIQNVEQSWENLNRSVLNVEACHVSTVEQTVNSIANSRLLNAMLVSEMGKLRESPTEENKMVCEVIAIWIDLIRRLSGVSTPMHITLPEELLTQIGNTIPGLKSHVEKMKSYKNDLKVKADLALLRSLNLASLCSERVQSENASNVMTASGLALSVLKGKLATVFSDWTKTLDDESTRSIMKRSGDFFSLLQLEFLRMLQKPKNSDFFERLQQEQGLSDSDVKSRNANLLEVLRKVNNDFQENVSFSQEKILAKLKTIFENKEDLRPLFELIFVVLPIKEKTPIIGGKEVDFLVKTLKTIFDNHLKIRIKPTGMKFGLDYGLGKDSEPVDITEIISLFLVRMLYLNSRLVSLGISPFFGNLKFDENGNIIREDEDSIAKPLFLTLVQITNSQKTSFANVLNSQHDCRSQIEIPDGEEFPSRLRLQTFLERLFLNCVRQKFKKDDFLAVFDHLKQQASTLFSTLESKGLKGILENVLSSCYKPSKEGSMMKMFSLGWNIITSNADNRTFRELSSFVGTDFNQLDHLSWPSRESMFNVLGKVCSSEKDKPVVMTEFYESLWIVMRFILSNLSSVDMTRVYSLYTMLEFFNANSRKYNVAHSFPYITHFFCALIVALQNIGLSLGAALRLFSSAIVNPEFKQSWSKGVKTHDNMNGCIRKASITSTTDFDKKVSEQPRNPRTKLDKDIPFPITFMLENLTAQSISSAPENLIRALKKLVYPLISEDNFKESPDQSLLNILFMLVSTFLSKKSIQLFKLFGVEIDEIGAIGRSVGGGGNDRSCEAAYLRTALPHIRTLVTKKMCAAMSFLKMRDDECLEASSQLDDTDIRDRSIKIRVDVVLEFLKKLVSNMGIVSMSSLDDIQTIGGVINHIKSKQSFVDSIFLKNLKDSLFVFAFSFKQAGQDARKIRQLRRQFWEKQQAELSVVDSAAQKDDEQQTSLEVVAVSASLTVVQSSSEDLMKQLSDDNQEIFDSFQPSVILMAGLIVYVLRSILTIKNSNAKEARYRELCSFFPEFFQAVFLQTCFEIVSFSDSELTPEFLVELESSYTKNYSSKFRLCEMLGIEITDQVGSYLAACFRESREKVLTFIATQPSPLTDVQIPESFPDSNADDADGDDDEASDDAESDADGDDDEASDDAESDADGDDDEASDDADADGDDDEASDDDDADESDADEASDADESDADECENCAKLGKPCTMHTTD